MLSIVVLINAQEKRFFGSDRSITAGIMPLLAIFGLIYVHAWYKNVTFQKNEEFGLDCEFTSSNFYLLFTNWIFIVSLKCHFILLSFSSHCNLSNSTDSYCNLSTWQSVHRVNLNFSDVVFFFYCCRFFWFLYESTNFWEDLLRDLLFDVSSNFFLRTFFFVKIISVRPI